MTFFLSGKKGRPSFHVGGKKGKERKKRVNFNKNGYLFGKYCLHRGYFL